MPTISLHRLMICVSASCILTLDAWIELFPGTADQYYQGFTSSWHSLCAIWVALAFIACLLYAGLCIANRTHWPHQIKAATCTIILVSAIDPCRRLITQNATAFESITVPPFLTHKYIYLITVVPAGCILVIILFFSKKALKIAKKSLLILFFLPLVLTVSIVKGLPGARPKSNVPSSGSASLGIHATKIVVLIFDEWDYEYTFTRRPPHIQLSEVDRFAKEYTSFENCLPPGGETIRSLPGLITGSLWSGAVPVPSGDVILKHSRSNLWTPWSQVDDIFVTLSQAGWHIKLIQWWQVYGKSYQERRPGLDISHYDADPLWQKTRSDYATFSGSLIRQLSALVWPYRSYLHFFKPRNGVPAQSQMASLMQQELLQHLREQNYDLVWAHLPFPHSPAIVNARTGEFLTAPVPQISNLDNMFLVNQTLERTRKVLESMDLWDQTMVILTSDHWQRDSTGDHLPSIQGKTSSEQGLRVPLLVKFPHQKSPHQIRNRISNVIIKNWIEALSKNIKVDPSQAQANSIDLPHDFRNFLINPVQR